MATSDKNNPSVVKEGKSSNYNLTRGGLGQADINYIEDLEKTMSNPPAQTLPTEEYYPTMRRSINVGQISSRTLGSVPLFAAGQGLLPIGMLQAKKEADYKASLEKFAMFGPANNEIFNQYVELKNPWAQDEFNAKLQQDLNDTLDDLAKEFGGDYGKARLAMKYMPQVKQKVNSYKNYAKGYDFLFDRASQVLQDAADPTKHVDPETFNRALKFFQNHDELGTKSIGELEGYINEFRTYMGVDSVVQNTTANIAKRITTTIAENPDYSTDAMKVLEQTKITGYSDAEITKMIEDSLIAYPYIKNNPELRQIHERKFRTSLEHSVEKQVYDVRKNYAENQSNWQNYFGVTPDGHGTSMVGLTSDGKGQYNTEYISIPPKNFDTPVHEVKLNVAANEYVSIKDEKGNMFKGYFNTPFNAIFPKRLYKDEAGELQVSSIIEAFALQPRIDPATGLSEPGIAKGEVKFYVVGEGGGISGVKDVHDLARSYEIIMPEKQAGGQMTTHFGKDFWQSSVSTAEAFKTSKVEPRTHAPRMRFLTKDEAQTLTTQRRLKKVEGKLGKMSDEEGIEYLILDESTYTTKRNPTTILTYQDLLDRGYKKEQIEEAILIGKLNPQK
jgi:hypothetical protein